MAVVSLAVLSVTEMDVSAPAGYMTANEAANALEVTPSWIRQLCRRGTLECIKTGRDWLVTVESVERYQERVRKPGDKTGNL